MIARDRYQVIVVGAGPVGLLVALRLGRAGIKTLVVERHGSILPTTRACVYQPVVLPALRELGFLRKALENAFLNYKGICWRDGNGQVLAKLPVGSGPGQDANSRENFDGILLLGQQRMAKLILEELEPMPNVDVLWNTAVTGIQNVPEDNPESIQVHCRRGDSADPETIEADWLLGADGSSSGVRKAAGIPFEGFTWSTFKLIGADVWHDFSKSNGYPPMNFVVHPDHWAVIIYTGEDSTGRPDGGGTPLWRVAFAADPASSENPDDILKLCSERISQYAAGTKPSTVRISRAEPYLMQQRCAGQARKGRVLLAGDALHSNNPIGGLGLTTGIVDACCFANVLVRVLKGGEPQSLVTECADARRDAWLNVTNPSSIRNVKQLMSTEPEDVREREEFLRKVNGDPDFASQWSARIRQLGANLFTPPEVDVKSRM